MLVGAVIQEQCTFQCGVVTGNHREAVKAEDVALVDLARRDRVMCTIGVDTGLEPGPGVHQFGIRESAGNFAHHRLSGMQGYFVFWHLITQGFDDGRTADVRDARAMTDDRVFFGGLDHAHTHARCGDIHQLSLRIAAGEFVAIEQVQMVEFDADAPGLGQGLLDRDEVIVALPVGVDDVFSADGTAPWLTAINVGADGHGAVLGHDQRVLTPEGAVQEIAVVVDVVIRREDCRVDIVLRQISPQFGLAVGIFLSRERRVHFFAVLDLDGFRHLHVIYPCQ
ncbi:hypothetical protein D3C85_1104830 [compost metagenome]